jgi:hypothetical protein
LDFRSYADKTLDELAKQPGNEDIPQHKWEQWKSELNDSRYWYQGFDRRPTTQEIYAEARKFVELWHKQSK